MDVVDDSGASPRQLRTAELNCATLQPAAAAQPINLPALAVAELGDFSLHAGGAERDCALPQIPGYREGTAGRHASCL